MQAVLKVIDDWRTRIEDHPLHRWLVAEDDGIEAEKKLWFSLYFTNFIMYFRELNLYHVGYPEDVTGDPRRSALTAHALEDMTHSRLFMRDFKTLGWDKLLPWKPSEVFQWLFTHEVNEQLRRRTVTIAKLYIEATDPAVRYAVVEAIETCGNALFRHTAQLADRYRAEKKKELIYWGTYHLARETGHAVEDGEEQLFAKLELTSDQRAEASARASRAFELIDEQNSHMLELAQETIAHGGFQHRKRPADRIVILPEELPSSSDRRWPESYHMNFWPERPHPTQQPLVARLLQCASELRNPEMLNFLTPTDTEIAVSRLRTLLLFFATDSTGTPTFYRYMVPFMAPRNAEERAISRMAHYFGSRSKLVYLDWKALQLDECLGWPVSRTLEFIYLDSATETHRDLRAAITHHIDVTLEPVQRYWTVVALKVMSGIFAEDCAKLARFVEDKLHIELPYLSLRRTVTERLAEDLEADAVQFETRALTPEAVNTARAAIERIAQAARVRNQCLLRSVQNRDYAELLPEAVDLRLLAPSAHASKRLHAQVSAS